VALRTGRVYWRPAGASRRALVGIALLSVVALFVGETTRWSVPQADYDAKFEAAQRAQEAFEVIRRARLRRGPPIDPVSDPTESGLIGLQGSPVTTSAGSLSAKRTSANPNFAAVLVEYLQRIGVREDDTVAVGFSGSFPALNIAVLSALHALHLNGIAITSTGASNWGANIPGFLWPDMERLLAHEGLFNTVSVAASLGGVDDSAVGLSDAGRRLLEEAAERNELLRLPEGTLEEAVDRRMALYEEAAAGRPIVAYINVGGGAVSMGGKRGKGVYGPGLNWPASKATVDSVIGRFLDRGVPVVHLTQIESIAEEHGLPIAPATPPRPGEGAVFQRGKPSRVVVACLLVVLCGTIVLVGHRGRQRARTMNDDAVPSGAQG